MRSLYRDNKPRASVISRPFDFNQWLASINSTFVSAVVDDAPGIVESSVIANGVVTITLSGGEYGGVYRIGITCTAANGLTRSTVWEVSVPRISPTSEESGDVGTGVGNVDGGSASSVYGGIAVINGGGA